MFTFLKRSPSTSINERVFRRAKFWDATARYFIVGGGILVIICVIGILFLIASVSLPLFLPPGQEILTRFQLKQHGSTSFLSVAMDEYLESASFLDEKGLWHFYELKKGIVLLQKQSRPPGDTALKIRNVEFYGQNLFTLVWQDGSASVLQVQFLPQFTEKGRLTIHDLLEVASFPASGRGTPLKTLARASLPDDDNPRQSLVQLFPGNRIEITQKIIEEDFFRKSTERILYRFFARNACRQFHCFNHGWRKPESLCSHRPGRIVALVFGGTGRTGAFAKFYRLPRQAKDHGSQLGFWRHIPSSWGPERSGEHLVFST